MARLYYPTTVTSDLSGGADFNRYMNPTTSFTSTGLTFATASAATEISYCFTVAASPSFVGALSGNYTVSIDIATANSNLTLSVQLNRINSAGTVQTAGGFATGQVLTTTGQKTFTFTALSLGTWAETDRLRLDVRIINAAMNTQSTQILFADEQTYVLTPFSVQALLCT